MKIRTQCAECGKWFMSNGFEPDCPACRKKIAKELERIDLASPLTIPPEVRF